MGIFPSEVHYHLFSANQLCCMSVHIQLNVCLGNEKKERSLFAELMSY